MPSNPGAAADAATEPGPCNSSALRRATRRVSQFYDRMLLPCGLRSTQRTILVNLARADGLGLGTLAERLVMDRSALAHNLKPLQREGLVVVLADPRDRRVRRIGLTAAGQARLEASRPLWEAAQRGFEAAFGQAEARALRQVLERVAAIDLPPPAQVRDGSKPAGPGAATER